LQTGFDWFVNRLQPTWTGPVGSGPVFTVCVKYKNRFWSRFSFEEVKDRDRTGLSSTINTHFHSSPCLLLQQQPFGWGGGARQVQHIIVWACCMSDAPGPSPPPCPSFPLFAHSPLSSHILSHHPPRKQSLAAVVASWWPSPPLVIAPHFYPARSFSWQWFVHRPCGCWLVLFL
jgi:hypothetical protein